MEENLEKTGAAGETKPQGGMKFTPPTNCVGCGMCLRTGICILNGETVIQRVR